MKNLKTRLAVLLLSTFCLLTAAYGQFTPSDDSYTDSLAPTVNYGTQPTLQMLSQTVHGHAPAVDSTFIRFDLTAVPTGYTGASVAKATLKLFVNAVRKNGSFNVNLVNGAWTEKALTYDNQPAITTTLASSIPLTAISNNATYVEIDITPAVVDWLNNTDPNDGIALVPNGGLYATFDSKENTGTSHLPELDIVFVGGVSSVTTPNGSGLMGGGTGNVSLSLTNSCNINQVLSYNGDEWVCHTVSGSGGGTVTSVGSGTGLTGGPITTSGTLSVDPNVVPLLSLENQFTASQSVIGSLTATNLGASGTVTAGGGAVLPASGNSQTSGSPSSPLDLTASASNGTNASNQTFRWQAVNADGATPTANLDLLFGSGGGAPAKTGLSIAANGIISFATGQTFGSGGGSGTVTSVAVTSGGGLLASPNPITTSGTLTIDASVVPLLATSNTFGGAIMAPSFTSTGVGFTGNGAGLTNVNAATLGGFSPGVFATLGANAFNGSQTIMGGSVGIGTTTPQATLDVNGSINLPNTTSATVGVLSLGGQPFLHNYGTRNTFVGGSGNFTMGGTDNVGTGEQALVSNTSGLANSAFGGTVLWHNTMGSYNNGFGNQVLENNTTGSNNNGFGHFALSSSNGQSNSAFGDNALGSLTTGNSNIALGANAGDLLQGSESNDIYIGNQGVGNESNTIRIGTTGTHNTAYIAGTLNVANLVTGSCTGCGGGGGGVSSVTGTSGITSNPPTGAVTLSLTPASCSSNTALVALPAVCSTTPFATTATNSFTGTQTMPGLIVNGNATATNVTATASLSGNTVSANSGYLLNNGTTTATVLASNTVAGTTNDVFLGFGAGTFTGGAYGANNIGLGNSTLTALAGGADNTASGYDALRSTSSGSDNTALGSFAAEYNTTGSNNTALGYNAGPDSASTALNYSTAIGAGAVVSASNALVLGGPQGSAAAVNVGIGTATPQAALDVHGNLNVTGTVTCGSGCGGGGGSGTVTSVGSGAGLAGGPITSSGTLYIPSGGVTNAMLANSSLTVAAGAGLTGGGPVALGASTALNIDTTKVPLLSGGNSFTGTQKVAGYVQIGTNGLGGQLNVSSLEDRPGIYVLGYYGPNGTGLSGSDGVDSTAGDADLTGGAGSGGIGLYGQGGNGYLSGGGTDGPGGFFLGGQFATGGDGVRAQAGSGYAGNFTGNVTVSGTLSAAAKNFKIDHPLDPANKYLVHASVESSEMKNIYDGNVTTDARGEATVELPDWFEALNTDFRYQLTVIGQFAQAIIANEIADHHFTVRTDKPNVKVSWQVTGVRQDAYAKAHPLVVEEGKEARLKGFYLHPELYGATDEEQIEWARHPEIMKRIKERSKKQAAH